MSAREQVAEAIYQAHRPYKNLDDDVNAWIYRQSADAAIAAHLGYLAATGHVIVKLPEQMTDRSHVAEVLRSLPMWAFGDAWTCLREPDLIEFEADSQQVYGEFSARAARDLAAALLAAAERAEASEPRPHRLTAANCKQAQDKGYPISAGDVCFACKEAEASE